MHPAGIEFVQKARTELVSSWALITLRCFFCWMPTLSKKCICCDKWKENISLERKIMESLVAIMCASKTASVSSFHFPWTSVLFFFSHPVNFCSLASVTIEENIYSVRKPVIDMASLMYLEASKSVCSSFKSCSWFFFLIVCLTSRS